MSEEQKAQRTVCIYGAASEELDPVHTDVVEDLARKLAQQGFGLVFGGGSTGIMGAAARGFAAEGAPVTGVLTGSVWSIEGIFDDMERIDCENLAARKADMERRADAFVVATGGLGTLDELFNLLAQIKVGEMDKPVAILNIDGYYDTLLAFLREMVDARAAHPRDMQSFSVFDNPDDLVVWLS